MTPYIGYEKRPIDPTEQEKDQKQVFLPGVLITALSIASYTFNGVDLNEKEAKKEITDMENQSRKNLQETNPKLEEKYAEMTSKKNTLESQIRNVMPAYSRIRILKGNNGGQSTVTLQQTDRMGSEFSHIQRENIPQTPFWPALINKLDSNHNDKFLSVTQHTETSFKLYIHENYNSNSIINLQNKLALQLETSFNESKSDISLSSGEQDVLQAQLIDRKTVSEGRNRQVRVEEHKLILLCDSKKKDKAIEIIIPIPTDSGLLKDGEKSIFRGSNKYLQHNMNILGVLLTNLTAATSQISK